MELITTELLRDIIKKCGESDDIESVLEVKGEPAVGEAENFCSNLVRTKVKVKLVSGKIVNKTLVLKVFLKKLEPEAFKEMKLFFANEVTMYDNILVNLAILANNHNLKDPRAWARCYFASTDLLILDDLKEEGFTVASRQAGLTLDEGLLVIRFLGKLHALSLVAQKRGVIDSYLIRRVYTWVQTDNWTSRYIQKAIRTVGELVTEWGKEWKDVGERIKSYEATISTTLNALFKEKVKIAVVNHGDAWVNNIMIKYNQDVKTIKFVDFQNATYNSYAWDLVYFLFTSLVGQVMRPNYDTLLGSYRREFLETLEQLGEDVGLAPSMDEIKAEIVRLHPFCLAISCTVMAIVFSTAKEEIQIDDLTTNDAKLRALYSNENFKSTMKTNIKYFVEQQVL